MRIPGMTAPRMVLFVSTASLGGANTANKTKLVLCNKSLGHIRYLRSQHAQRAAAWPRWRQFSTLMLFATSIDVVQLTALLRCGHFRQPQPSQSTQHLQLTTLSHFASYYERTCALPPAALLTKSGCSTSNLLTLTLGFTSPSPSSTINLL